MTKVTSVRSSSLPPSTAPFAEQLKLSSGSLNKLETTRQSFQQQQQRQQQQLESGGTSNHPNVTQQKPNGSASVALPLLDNEETIDGGGGASTSRGRQHRATLIPPLSNGCCEEEEEDEYASVGFSLTDNASATTSPLLFDEEEDDIKGDDEGGNSLAERAQLKSEAAFTGRKMLPPTSSLGREESYRRLTTPKITMEYSPSSELGESHYTTRTAATHDSSSNDGDSSPPRLQRGLFQNSTERNEDPSSPVISEEGGRTAPPPPQQETNVSSLPSKLPRESLQCQSPSDSLSLHTPTTDASVDNITTHESPSCISNGSRHKNNVFGAWAQIESLQQRCLVAEERARRECRRAEVAIFEKSCLAQKEPSRQQGVAGETPINGDCEDNLCREDGRQRAIHECDVPSQNCNEQGTNGYQGHGCNDKDQRDPVRDCNEEDDVASSHCATLTTEQAVAMPVIIRERKVTDAAPLADVPPNVTEPESAPPTLPHNARRHHEEQAAPSCASLVGPREDGSDAATLQSWKHRALEAEQRLAVEASRLGHRAAAIVNGAEPPDLIRLKNAEIEVLRSQIHRLERRLHEGDSNHDLLLFSARSSAHSYLHHGNGDIMTPPLLVSPAECMASNTSTGPRVTEAEEFRLLRNEVSQLQYQLRTNVKNTGAATANSTAGESTLSSIEYERGNAYNDTGGREEVDEEGQEEDMGNASSSLWDLCCVRGKSRRGYGRVLNK